MSEAESVNDKDAEFDELLNGKPTFNLWQEQTYLLRLLSTSTLDDLEREAYEDEIIDMNLDPDYAREIAEYLNINQLHFSNFKSPSQTATARFIQTLSKNTK